MPGGVGGHAHGCPGRTWYPYMRPPEMRPRPRSAAASETKVPSAVLTPPTPFVKVTSLEKATSSSTWPQEVQHLEATEGSPFRTSA